MAATDELGQIFSKLQQSSNNPAEAAVMYKEAMCQLVNQSLTNLSKISEDLAQQSNKASYKTYYEHCLKFISHCVSHCPHIVSSIAEGNGNPTSQEGTSDIEEKEANAIATWLVSRLVRMLSHSGLRAIYDDIQEVLVHLLHTVEPRDTALFRQLLTKIILTMQELVALNQALYEADAPGVHEIDYLCLPDEDLGGQGDGPHTLRGLFLPIEIQNVDDCELTQTNIGHTLTEMTLEIYQFLPTQSIQSLWGTLCCQLEMGEVDLKKMALTLTRQLLEVGCIPQMQILDYFVCCLCAMVELLCSKSEEVEGDYEGLEQSLNSCLTYAVSMEKLLNQEHNKSMLTEIISSITKHGIQELRSAELKCGLFSVLVILYRRIPDPLLLGGPLHEQSCHLYNWMMAELGRSADSEHFVHPLTAMVMLNLTGSIKQTARGQSPQNREATSDTRTDTKPGKKRKLLMPSCDSSSSVEPGNVKHSLGEGCAQYAGLLKKLDQFCQLLTHPQGASQDVLVFASQAIHIIIEVIVSCAISWQDKDQTNKENITWIESGLLLKLCESTKRFLQTALQDDASPVVISQVYPHLVKAYSTLGIAHDVMVHPSEILTNMTWILSISWVPNEMNWLDLKVTNPKEVAQIARNMVAKKDTIEPETVGKCVLALCQMPKDASPRWRTHVLKVAINDTDAAVQESAVLGFPYQLYYSGPNANHLVYDLLHELLRSKKTTILSALAGVVGPLACIISRKAMLVRDDPERILHLEINCSHCDDWDDDETSGSTKDRPKIVDPAMFKPFMQLLHCEDEVKMMFVKGLYRMLGHLGVKTSNVATMEILNECLQLLEDPDYNVRLIFSQAIKTLVREGCAGSCSQIDSVIVEKLTDVESRSKGHPRLQETLLLTVGQLARYAEGDLLLVLLIILVKRICSPFSPLAAALARQQVQEVASYKGISTNSLFTQHANAICKVLVDTIHAAMQRGSEHIPLDMMMNVAAVFDYEDVKEFLQSTQKYMVPYLVGKANSQLIKILAKEMGLRYRQLLASNLRFIFSHIVTIFPQAEQPRALEFLTNETDVELRRLLRPDTGIVNELLLHLSTHYDQVINGLNYLVSNKDDKHQGSHDINTREQLAKHIQPRLLAILVFFDTQLLNNTTPLEEKKEALESIIAIMELFGPKITAVRLRIITTLRNGLQLKAKGFAELNCKAWNRFVRSVELSALGPILPQIIVNLLQLLQQLPRQVADIFNYLIVDNRNKLKEYFCDLYFLPDIPELADVNAVLSEHKKTVAGDTDLRSMIEYLLRGVVHESLDVKRHALARLKELLHNNQLPLQKFVLSGETVDPVVSNLVSVLLLGCREASAAVRDLCGECLGEIGAIDPGRLELMTKNPKEELAKFKASVTDENFVYELINVLAKAFLRAKETTTQDSVAYGIQEILTLFEIREDADRNSPGSRLWRRFDEDVQEIVTPFLNSRYKLHYEQDWSNLETPVYGSKKGSTFTSWLCTLTGFLGSKVKEEKPRVLVKACRGVIRHDSRVAQYLLPYVLVHALMDSDEEGQALISKEIMAVLHDVKKSTSRNVDATDFRHMSAQTVFSMLDHLTKWTRHRVMVLSLMKSRGRSTSLSSESTKYTEDKNYLCIQGFLDKIPKDVLAFASVNCKAYSRSLMHIEQFIRSPGQSMDKHLDFLQKLYLAMDEPDGVAGVMAVKLAQPTLVEEVLAHESLGQMADASACYDRAFQLEPENVNHFQGLLKSFMNLGQLSTSMELADGVCANKSSWCQQVNAYRVEAAWKLGQWDKLEQYLKTEDHAHTWSISVGKILSAAKDKDEPLFRKHLENARTSLMGPLSAASMEWGSYQRGYEYIVRLHMLNELENGVKALLHFPEDRPDSSQQGGRLTMEGLLEQWHNRLQLAQSSFRTQEPVIQLRRVVLNLAQQEGDVNMEMEIGKSWLDMARVAREAGHLQTAYTALLTAGAYNLRELCLEKAKYLWQKGNTDQAQSCLEKALEDQYPDRANWSKENSQENKVKRIACAKVLLLLGQYQEQTASQESNSIVKQYREVINMRPDWEDGHFYLAKYYDKIMTSLVENERPEKKGEFIMRVVQNFGMSLMHGNHFIYQSMPRLLSLWLDFGSTFVEEQPKIKKNQILLSSMQGTLDALNRTVNQLANKLAPYQFLTAFPQLISRICHAEPTVFQQLLEIIAHLLVDFPQQAMWMMMAVSKSSYQMRVKRCQEIFTKAKLLSPELAKFLQDATKLTDRLLDLCNKQTEQGVSTMSISQHFKPLQRLIDDRNFSQIMLPLERLTTVTLPSSEGVPAIAHNPFPGKQVFIQGFEDTVEVLSSLQKPKKITLRGSDGKFYIMLCKPKDDLRKDNRLMEFNGIVNKCLRKDPESRKRGLCIRTYTVTPLNEECGMLEWVPNTHGLRNILMKLYKERGMYTGGQELRSFQVPVNAPLEKKMDVFKNKLLPRHPPLFREWFFKTFPDPTSWYNARQAYCRTAAVMSMVGFILGLGDRHGENILMDSVHGDCVHVDFNCLFNKGETFDYPEIVPFRLTHNMIDAMGPMGYEGIFRRSCEVTLRVMRDQMDPLMSVLKTFVYDPLCEWSKPTARGRTAETGEMKNEKASHSMMNVESRLKGLIRTKAKSRGLPLSVEGHVNHLIQEATDEKNLCAMYIGWAAYM